MHLKATINRARTEISLEPMVANQMVGGSMYIYELIVDANLYVGRESLRAYFGVDGETIAGKELIFAETLNDGYTRYKCKIPNALYKKVDTIKQFELSILLLDVGEDGEDLDTILVAPPYHFSVQPNALNYEETMTPEEAEQYNSSLAEIVAKLNELTQYLLDTGALALGYYKIYTSTYAPVIGGHVRLDGERLSREPKVDDYTSFVYSYFDQSADATKNYQCIAKCIDPSEYEFIISEFVLIQGEKGDRGATGRDALVYNYVIESFVSGFRGDVYVDQTYFNRKPVVGDKFLAIIPESVGAGATYIAEYEIKSQYAGGTRWLASNLWDQKITGPKGEIGATPEIAITADIDNSVGTPTVSVDKSGTDEQPQFTLHFQKLKGETGETPDVTVKADIDAAVGTPNVTIEKAGTKEQPEFTLHFTNMKGEKGARGTSIYARDTSLLSAVKNDVPYEVGDLIVITASTTLSYYGPARFGSTEACDPYTAYRGEILRYEGTWKKKAETTLDDGLWNIRFASMGFMTGLDALGLNGAIEAGFDPSVGNTVSINAVSDMLSRTPIEGDTVTVLWKGKTDVFICSMMYGGSGTTKPYFKVQACYNITGPQGPQGVDGPPGEVGPPGEAAGIGVPTAEALFLPPGTQPTVHVSASGPDTAKVFAFEFGIPKPAEAIQLYRHHVRIQTSTVLLYFDVVNAYAETSTSLFDFVKTNFYWMSGGTSTQYVIATGYWITDGETRYAQCLECTKVATSYQISLVAVKPTSLSQEYRYTFSRTIDMDFSDTVCPAN